jgi:hypothetical protein
MPTPQEEVAAFFADVEAYPDPDAVPDEMLRILGRASRKAFADEDIRQAFWFFLVDHPMAFVLRPAVLGMHAWVRDELRKHAA